MDVDQLKTFIAAVEQGSIARAASATFQTTMAAKRRLDSLEAEVDLPLLERGPHGVRPTIAGETFHRHARTIVSCVEVALSAARTATRPKLVRMAANPLAHATGYPRIIDQFTRDNPGCEVQLEPIEVDDYFDALLNERCDACITTYDAAAAESGLRFSHPFPFRLAGFSLRSSSLCGPRARPLTAYDLARLPVAGSPHSAKAALDAVRHVSGNEPTELSMCSKNLNAILGFVRNGGCYIMPEDCAGLFEDEFGKVELDEALATQWLFFVSRPALPDHVERFIECAWSHWRQGARAAPTRSPAAPLHAGRRLVRSKPKPI